MKIGGLILALVTIGTWSFIVGRDIGTAEALKLCTLPLKTCTDFAEEVRDQCMGERGR